MKELTPQDLVDSIKKDVVDWIDSIMAAYEETDGSPEQHINAELISAVEEAYRYYLTEQKGNYEEYDDLMDHLSRKMLPQFRQLFWNITQLQRFDISLYIKLLEEIPYVATLSSIIGMNEMIAVSIFAEMLGKGESLVYREDEEDEDDEEEKI